MGGRIRCREHNAPPPRRLTQPQRKAHVFSIREKRKWFLKKRKNPENLTVQAKGIKIWYISVSNPNFRETQDEPSFFEKLVWLFSIKSHVNLDLSPELKKFALSIGDGFGFFIMSQTNFLEKVPKICLAASRRSCFRTPKHAESPSVANADWSKDN